MDYEFLKLTNSKRKLSFYFMFFQFPGLMLLTKMTFLFAKRLKSPKENLIILVHNSDMIIISCVIFNQFASM